MKDQKEKKKKTIRQRKKERCKKDIKDRWEW